MSTTRVNGVPGYLSQYADPKTDTDRQQLRSQCIELVLGYVKRLNVYATMACIVEEAHILEKYILKGKQ